MFRIEVFVEDKRLAAFLNASAGLVHSMTPPQPVVNAQKKNGKLVEQTSGKQSDMVHHELVSQGLTNITPKEIQAVVKKLGGGVTSYGYAIKEMLKAKQIKSLSRGHYQVIT